MLLGYELFQVGITLLTMMIHVLLIAEIETVDQQSIRIKIHPLQTVS